MEVVFLEIFNALQEPTGAFVGHGTLKGILQSTFRVFKFRDLQVPR